MIAAISRFTVKNGEEAEVRAAFEARPRAAESVPGFLGLEVFQSGATFTLLTRWCDEVSFESWHHALIPAGLQLDPSKTELLVGARIDGVTSEGSDAEWVSELSLPLARFLRGASTLHVAAVDGEGLVVRANAAFGRLVGGEPIGRAVASLLTPASHEELGVHLAGNAPTAILLQFASPLGDPSSLRAFTRRMPFGFALVGEPPFEDHRSLEARLMALNAELAVTGREQARQARLLEKANRELHDSQWHLKKISEVLPICMSCRAVKTGEHTWEDVATFLTNSSDFLSHGYCARCAEAIIADLDRTL